VEPEAKDTIQNACYAVRLMKAHGWRSAEVSPAPATCLARPLSSTGCPWSGGYMPHLRSNRNQPRFDLGHGVGGSETLPTCLCDWQSVASHRRLATAH